MSSQNLRQYIDILNEAEAAAQQTKPEDDVSPILGVVPWHKQRSQLDTTDTKPATAPTTAAQPAADSQEPVAEPGTPVEELQQALLDAGFELPRFGADGKMGPETRAAIKAAEMVLGRKPTGTVTVDELKNIDQAIKNNALTQALSAIEAILAKYKIKTEEVNESRDEWILRNINLFTEEEKLTIWRELLREADGRDVPAYQRKQAGADFFDPRYAPKPIGNPSQAPGAPATKTKVKWDPETKNWYTLDPNGRKVFQGGLQKPKQNLAARWADKLGKKLGKNAAAKVAGRVAAGTAPAATGIGAPLAVALTVANVAWLAWDVGSALYSAFKEGSVPDLTPEEQTVIATHINTVMQYGRDPQAMDSLPDDLKARVAKVINGLKALSIEEPQA